VVPETPIVEAIETMLKQGCGGLPVVRNGQLVGIVSEHDLLRIARELLLTTLGVALPATVRRRVAKSKPRPASV
jgi:CBS domain-containing protein